MWTGLINGLQIKKLEDVQRLALSIILGREAKSYSTNLTTLDLPTLEERRLLLTKEFAVSLYTSKRHLGYLVTNPRFGDRSRVDQPRLIVPSTANLRGDTAPLNFMGTLINNMGDEEFKCLSKGRPLPPLWTNFWEPPSP